MKRLMLALIASTFGVFVAADAGWFGPKSYEDCILENMKGITLQLAAQAVQGSCRAKFPQDCHAWKKRFDSYVEANRDKPWVQYGLSDTRDPYALSPRWGMPVPEGCKAVLAE